MIIWARHIAWLVTIPKGQTKSRYDQEEERFDRINLPDLGAFEQIAEYFDEIGAVRQLPDGVTPISYAEIDGWARATGTPINHWVVNVLMNMSRQYYYQMGRSSDPMVQAPYTAFRTDEDMVVLRKRTSEKIRKLF